MVAIKIQSIDDIIKAYLENLSFSRDLSAKLTEKIKPLIADKVEKGAGVLEQLDKILLKSAKDVFADLNMTDEQLIALFKFTFLRAGGAKLWGKDFFRTKVSEKFKSALQNEVVVNAPVYIMSQMKAQKIESVTAKNFLIKLFSHKGK